MAPPAWTADRAPEFDGPSCPLAGRPTITPEAPKEGGTPPAQVTPAAIEKQPAIPAAEAPKEEDTATAQVTPVAIEREQAIPAAEAQPEPVVGQADWPVALRDTFDDGPGRWDVGAVHFDVASLRRTAAEGMYTWELDARQPVVVWSESAFDTTSDFKATLRARLASGAATDLSLGLAVCPADVADMRLFLLSPSDGATVRHGLGESAEAVRDWMPVAALQPDAWNQLALKVAGSNVSFQVNGQQAIELPVDALPSGRLCVAVWARRPGSYVVQFDDFEVYGPPGIVPVPATATPALAAATPPPAPTPVAWGRLLPEPPHTSPPQWPIVFWDEFVDNGNGWFAAEQFNREIESSQVVEGTFTWQFSAMDRGHSVVKAPCGVASDFYAAVDVRRYSGTEELWYGLAFRRADARHYYCFLINDQRKYQIWARAGDRLQQLVEPTSSELIQPRGPNRVGVAGEGMTFTFFVNGQVITALAVDRHDLQFTEGLLGLALDAEAGDRGIIDFDNFELRVPASP